MQIPQANTSRNIKIFLQTGNGIYWISCLEPGFNMSKSSDKSFFKCFLSRFFIRNT